MGQNGFTLLEVLIVMVVLGALAAVIVPSVTEFTPTAQKAAAQAEMASLQKAVYSALANNGTGNLSGLGPVNSSTDTDPKCADWVQGGLGRVQGEWTPEANGLIISGNFPKTNPVWSYDHGAWTRVP